MALLPRRNNLDQTVAAAQHCLRKLQAPCGIRHGLPAFPSFDSWTRWATDKQIEKDANMTLQMDRRQFLLSSAAATGVLALGGCAAVPRSGSRGVRQLYDRIFEAMLVEDLGRGEFCEGDTPSIADCCLVPQVYNARRFGVDLAPFPNIRQIEAACLARPEFDAARPERQPDAP